MLRTPVLRVCLTLAVSALAVLALAPLRASAADVAGVTADSITIGMFGPISGSYSAHRVVYDGAQAVYKQVNDQGGLFGRKIKVVFEDDGCDIGRARAAVKKLISRDKVFLLHGGVCSASAYAVRQEAIDEGVPFMVMAATMDKITEPVNHFVFTTTLTGSKSGQTIGDFIRSMPEVKKVAIVKHPDDWSEVQVTSLDARLADAGIKVASTVEEERNAADATTQVLSIKEAAPDATAVILYPAEMAVFLRDSLKYGLKGPFITPVVGMDMHEIEDRAGSLKAVSDVYTGSFLIGAPGSKQAQPYVDLFKKYYPDESVQALDFYGMSGAYAIVEALRRAGPDLSREKFIAALETLKDFNAGPSACTITITPENHQGCESGTIWTLVGNDIVAIGPTWKAVKGGATN
ncbi:MAG: ABC transporter substrate-binding protein [Acidisphaera sp.]|nr:ABC transporter substrate-binding protein [Acidisphaera sp.]